MTDGERPRSEGNASEYDTGQAGVSAAASYSPLGPFPAFLWLSVAQSLEFTWFGERAKRVKQLPAFGLVRQ
jgi:hypothetical protein